MTEAMIGVIFRLLNFVLVVAIAVYAAAVYILPGIKAQFIKHGAYFDSLRRSHRSLQKEIQAVRLALEHDGVEQKQLTDKVTRWQAAVQDAAAALYAERDQRKKILEKQLKEHEDELVRYQAYKEFVPVAVSHARAELERLFSDKKAQKQYWNMIMQVVRKE